MKSLSAFSFAMIVACSAHAADSLYCPENHSYINTGMTQPQVIQACGMPQSKQTAKNAPVNRKVNVTQLIYNNQGTSEAFYGVWSIPTGSGGARLEVDLVDNKITSARLNGGTVNAFSVCGTNIQVGDPASMVYNNCGNPSMVNNTFIEQAIPGKHQVEIWTYTPGQYQKSFRLTFIDGQLQSIEN